MLNYSDINCDDESLDTVKPGFHVVHFIIIIIINRKVKLRNKSHVHQDF
jgi:hypothetical protein